MDAGVAADGQHQALRAARRARMICLPEDVELIVMRNWDGIGDPVDEAVTPLRASVSTCWSG